MKIYPALEQAVRDLTDPEDDRPLQAVDAFVRRTELLPERVQIYYLQLALRKVMEPSYD